MFDEYKKFLKDARDADGGTLGSIDNQAFKPLSEDEFSQMVEKVKLDEREVLLRRIEEGYEQSVKTWGANMAKRIEDRINARNNQRGGRDPSL